MADVSRLDDARKGEILFDYRDAKAKDPQMNIPTYLKNFADEERDEVRKILEMEEVLSI